MGERLKITLVLLALVAMVGAGCGSDDETTSSGSGSASSGSASESNGSANGSGDSESGSGDSESSSEGSESSSGDSADEEGSTLTKAEFVTQGNQICMETRDEIGSEIEGFLKENTDPSGTGAGLKEARE
ncbi:MAG TPA: hypothetical protein VEB65_07545, partial [Solirubrobacterales bacterium]|nr:hypothetical protein [Solirubrobacterales bacterium]